ncbi:MAG: LamG domain-containing protein [Planctomycetes bacterium]|nr:LamG domain-containing protein [Planctomycetota bacterium]
MLRPILSFASALALAVPACAQAQDFLLYKFEGACSNEVVNFAPGSTVGNGTLVANFGDGISPGFFGEGLAAGQQTPTLRNLVDTNWNPSTDPLTGNVTIAFWARQEQAFLTQLSYLFGMSGSGFRIFTNGAAGRGLYLRSATSPVTDMLLPDTTTDFQALAANAWVHIAITLDDTAHVATWYVNGTSVFTQANIGTVQVLTGGELQLGGYAGATGSAYTLDEVLFSRSLYPPAAIALLATSTRAGDGSYLTGSTTQCGAGNVTLDSVGGRPSLGNALYSLRITPNAPSAWLLLYGENRCTFAGTAPLPLDGGLLLPFLSGCTMLADPLVVLSGLGGPANPGLIPLPITPAVPFGANVWCQALTIALPGNAVSMSPGFAVGVGN